MQNVSNQFMRNRLHNRSILYVQIVAMQWKEYLGSGAYREYICLCIQADLKLQTEISDYVIITCSK